MELFINRYCRINQLGVFADGRQLEPYDGSPVPTYLNGLWGRLGKVYPKYYKMDPLSKLGFIASEIVFSDYAGNIPYAPEMVGVVLSNNFSSLDTDVRYYDSISEIPSPSLFVYTLPNIVIGEICIKNQFKGENAFFVSEQFDANFISEYVRQLFETQMIDACLCGWVDLMGNHFEAFLMWIEKKDTSDHITFQTENIQQLWTN